MHFCRKLSFCGGYVLYGGHFLLKFGEGGHKNILYDRDPLSHLKKIKFQTK